MSAGTTRGAAPAAAGVLLAVALVGGTAAMVRAEGTLTGLWSTRAGRSITVPPALAPGRVFAVTTDGRVQCYRLADGKRLWGRRLKDAGEAAPAWSPAGTGGRLCLSSGELGRVLQVLEGSRGRSVWSRQLDSAVTALAADDSVVVVLARSGTLAGWRAADGTALWTRRLGGWDPPPFLLREGRIFAPLPRDSLLALDARTGVPVWRAEVGGVFAAAPVAVGDWIALSDAGGSVAWIEPATGAVSSRQPRSEWQIQAGAASDGTLVTVSSGGRVECAGPVSGPHDWATPIESGVVGAPLRRGGMILVGTTSGTLSMLDARDGRLLQSFQAAGGFRVGPLAAGDTLLLADARGGIHAYLDAAGGD